VIVLFTDFGLEGPYVGQMKAVLHREAPGVPVIDLFADAPAHDVQAAAYLLAAYCQVFEAGAVLLCVVDPGVGDPARRALTVAADGRWFVGPDNGLFEIVARRSVGARFWELDWHAEELSASFHGRDLFAPAAAALARGEAPAGEGREWRGRKRLDWPDDLSRVIYLDHFGNAMTGLRAASLPDDAVLSVGPHRLVRARTFSGVAAGEAFWYENANGLAEIAVNRGRADRTLELAVGAEVMVLSENP
jgi:S-adenosylmethionine hydrolase